MKSKKKLVMTLIAAVAVVAAIAAVFITYSANQKEEAYRVAYVVIDGVEYSRTAQTLDLSGRQLTEIEKLQELTAVKTLNLRDTGLTIGQYQQLRQALPECEIIWSIPFQGGYVDSCTQELTLERLENGDLEAVEAMDKLTTVWALECTDYKELVALQALRPDLKLNYQVSLSGKSYMNYAMSISVADMSLDEFRQKAEYLPNLTRVTLTGEMPAKEEMLKLKNAYPAIMFEYSLEFFGKTFNSMDTTIDLSNVKFEKLEEVEVVLPYFYQLEQVDMVNCGFSNDTMAELNERHEDVKFVWTVNLAGLVVRTDAKYFMPAKYKNKAITTDRIQDLKYCTDMQVIDLGHYAISNVDFVEYMPNLKYLLLCDARLTDLTAIGHCTSLEFLELFQSLATDFWPLTNLSNLRDLNVSSTPCKIGKWRRDYGAFGDYTPLLQMTWLDRLWVVNNGLNSKTRQELMDALPNTMIVFSHGSQTGGGFRFTPRYFQQRDIMEMYYGAN